MGTSRKPSAPRAARSTPPVPESPETVIEITLGVGPAEQKVSKTLNESAEILMERSLEDLRNQGVSEQDLAAFFSAARLVCLARLWDADLEGTLLDYIGSGGTTRSLRDVLAMLLVPEIRDDW